MLKLIYGYEAMATILAYMSMVCKADDEALKYCGVGSLYCSANSSAFKGYF